MLACPRTLPALAVTLPLLLSAGCSKRELQIGTGRIDFDGGGDREGDPADAADAGPPPVDAEARDTAPPIDAAESPCVRVALPLPWTMPTSSVGRLEVAASGSAIAVTNRQSTQLDVRTYVWTGAIVGGFQFGSDTQFLPYANGNFLLIARGTTGDFVATELEPNLFLGTRLHTAAASATEHMLGAVVLPTATVLLTDEHFVNLTTGTSVPWTTLLSAADVSSLRSGRIYGIAGRVDRLLLAWGSGRALRLVVLDTAGTLVAVAADSTFLGELRSDTTTAIPFGSGLLMFDGNPVRLTQIGFDLSRAPFGQNLELRAFDSNAPRIAAIVLGSRPVAFWLTVFPDVDTTQGATIHQLYGCQLDPAAPAACVRSALIAATGLNGYTIGDQPLAAAALPGDSAFAVAHTDVTGRSWLRVADFACATPP